MTTVFDEVRTEIAHVVMVDLVAHSLALLPEQSRNVSALTEIVSGSPAFVRSKAQQSVLPIPSGDGIAILFFGNVTSAAECALEIVEGTRMRQMRVRVGIHSGLIHRQTDITGNDNVVGEGINTAQRVMSQAAEGQILLSPQFAHWLGQFDRWQSRVHPAGKAIAKHNLPLDLFELAENASAPTSASVEATPSPTGLRLVLLYRRKVSPDDEVLAMLERELTRLGHRIFIDRHLRIGVEWAKAIEAEIRSADGIIAIISDRAAGSEMLEYELEIARSEFLVRGKPYLLPVRVGSDAPSEGAVGSIVNSLNFTVWNGPQDDQRVLTELVSALQEPLRPLSKHGQLEPVGGAMTPGSPFYIERETDAEFVQAVKANESIILVKGPRQVGKTSLIGRGVRLVGELGWNSVVTDFQKLSSAQLASEERFYELLGATLARQLRFRYDFENEWLPMFGPNMNMDNFIRSLLEHSPEPLVWFMDETDKLFGAPFASDFFGLVRSWHNSRATDPAGPWTKLTLVIGYATEAHLFIRDLNQSPFNVGRRLAMRHFTLAEVAELNERYGRPISSGSELRELNDLVNGQPFLVRRALDTLARKACSFRSLMDESARDEGAFGDHLRRILVSLSQMPDVLAAVKQSLTSLQLPDSESIQRLIAAGVIRRNPNGAIEFACELYVRYLRQHIELGGK